MAREIGWYGWFRDGKGERYEAYWDGTAWTERRPRSAVPLLDVGEASGKSPAAASPAANASSPAVNVSSQEARESSVPGGASSAEPGDGKWRIDLAALFAAVLGAIVVPFVAVVMYGIAMAAVLGYGILSRETNGAYAGGAEVALVVAGVTELAALMCVASMTARYAALGDNSGTYSVRFTVSWIITAAVYIVAGVLSCMFFSQLL